MTIFATSSIVNRKESFYIVAKLSTETNTKPHSGYRNDYKKQLTGNQHCRNVCIIINSAFTAGGLSSPMFVIIYSLTLEEMPEDKIITIPVPGLTVGGHQDIYSMGIGYVTYVRGDIDTDKGTTEDNVEATVPVDSTSKESRIAQIYCEQVYHPFIKHIRKLKYGWEGDNSNIPEHLCAISWMDGANSQIKRITTSESLNNEERMKITICKYSASRTAVEQAADCGPMFKLMKKLVREMDISHAGFDNICLFLEQELIHYQVHQNCIQVKCYYCLPIRKKQF